MCRHPHIAPCWAVTVEADFEAAGFPCMMCCHIADGNFHCLVPYSDDAEGLALLRDIEDNMIKRVLDVGGTISGEHGIGLGKKRHMVKEHGELYIDMMRQIKKALDPQQIFNPGKIFDMDARQQTKL